MMNELLGCKEVSIYSFINETDKKIYITYAIETLPSVLFHLRRLKSIMLPDKDKYQFKIIETYDSRHQLYLRYKVHLLYQQYIKEGYTPISSYKPLQWEIQIRVQNHAKDDKEPCYRSVVRIRTSTNAYTTIGIYTNIQNAKRSIQNKTLEQVILSL